MKKTASQLGKKILIVDDNPDIADAMKIMLEMNGYQVETFSEEDVFQKVETFSPDLLLLDIGLFGQDGREICKKLKTQPTTKDLPIILTSANRNTKSMSDQSQADDFLDKPFDMDYLFNLVAKHIGE